MNSPGSESASVEGSLPAMCPRKRIVCQEEDKERPKHIRPELWEKFLKLEKRTDEVTKKSTERRVNELQKRLMKTVNDELSHPEDKDILREHDVKFGPLIEPDSRKRRKGKSKQIQQATEPEPSTSNRDWTEVKSYLGINDHLKGVPGRTSCLEQSVDKAVELGDYDLAESLSDRLATRSFGEKIAEAFDARDYVKKKKEEEEHSKAKKKKKLYWGFNQKHNWELKSNM